MSDTTRRDLHVPDAAVPKASAPLPSDPLGALADPAALLFDLDGTLVDTVALRIEAWVRAFASRGLTVDPERLSGYMGSDGRWLAGEIGHAAGVELDWEARDRLDRMSGAIFTELNVAPVPLPGATELLTALEESHLTFAIATSSQPGQVAVSVAALRLPSPPPITDGSHVERAKPEPDLLLASATQLDVPPARCWYVGDSVWDMMASVGAGMVAIGVTAGAADVAALSAAGAAVALSGLGDVHAELRRRGLVA
jgi:beta-phosphoglucomutase-like phosphatase (HAD superfamily)